MSDNFPQLFSPIKLGNTTLKNRIVSTGHHTYLADREPGPDLIAYHESRARGGAGLIVSEIIAVHPSAGFSSKLLSFFDASAIPAYRHLVEACHRHDCRIFAQLFHPGREILSTADGFGAIAYAPSALPNERFHIMPKPMDIALIESIVDGYAGCAKNLQQAGFDGVEIVGSHGYLPAQFLSPAVNQRDDDYGGDFDSRLKFIRDVITAIHQQAPGLTLGLRLSANDYEPEGMEEPLVTDICLALQAQLDYVSLVAGSSATLGASVHISPSMGFSAGYLGPMSEQIRAKLDIPVMVTGRINQPQVAEQIISAGQADLCGMTRAMICDPEMPEKARTGRYDDIRACIGCNQSCIGRAHKGLPISCLQNPQSGRELKFSGPRAAASSRRIVVVGAGPAGMKCAVVAAGRGHAVTLYDKAPQPGGQALLAQLLPGREEFGGLVTNLMRELESGDIQLVSNCDVDSAMLQTLQVDKIVLATGARAYFPAFGSFDPERTVSYEDVLLKRCSIGTNVVIADWRGDWTGIGLAERLASDGCRVKLVVNSALAGEALQIYTRNYYLGRLYRLGVEVVTHARLYGSDGDCVYFQNTLTDEPIIFDAIDTLVLAMGQQAESQLEVELRAAGINPLTIGDCVVPRTAEEAIFEGMQTAMNL
jgi:2,4-dienoyl-CoA reductase-like NADH-dependent reductase (Old Yellow Enzyme family)